MFTLEPKHKIATPCSYTFSRINLSINTYKSCAIPIDVITWLSSGLEDFFNVCIAFLNSSKLKRPGVRHI